jgi:hypothetical protein
VADRKFVAMAKLGEHVDPSHKPLLARTPKRVNMYLLLAGVFTCRWTLAVLVPVTLDDSFQA